MRLSHSYGRLGSASVPPPRPTRWRARIVDTNWNRWEDMRVREGDGKETVRPNADGSVGAGKATDMWNLFESVDLPIMGASSSSA